jgi:hypothetical protein
VDGSSIILVSLSYPFLEGRVFCTRQIRVLSETEIILGDQSSKYLLYEDLGYSVATSHDREQLTSSYYSLP